MPIYFTFVGNLVSISGVGGYKTAKVLHEDIENVQREVDVKYFQNNENTLSPNRTYLFNGTVIFVVGRYPKVYPSYVSRVQTFLR